MTITCIYIKTCLHCGLKYFGKSDRNKEFVKNKYKGSGKPKWINHLKFHNPKLSTYIIKEFKEIQKQEKIDFCIWFSKINNIVKSKKWANLMIENGLDGGSPKGINKSEETKEKMRNSSFWKGRKLYKETREKMSKIRIGINLSKETREKMSKSKLGNKNGKGNLGVKQKIVKCPHCEMSGGISPMKRWHFDNCKNLLN